MKKVTDVTSAFIFILPCLLTLFIPSLISSMVTEALTLCTTRIIPSLIPYLVFSQLITRTAIGEKAGKVFAPVLCPILGIKKNMCGTYITGMISGYPNGALCAGLSFSSGNCTRNEAEKIIALSNNSSFSFVCIVAGIHTLGSIKNGLILVVAQIFTTLVVAQILRLYDNEDKNINQVDNFRVKVNPSTIITKSISESCLNMLYICGYITIFYVISGVICHYLPKYYPIQFATKAIFEVSSAVCFSGIARFPLNCVLCAICIGFSGLSVMFQVCDICSRYELSPKLFIISRLLSLVILPIVTVILLLVLPREAISVFNSANAEAAYSGYFNIYYALTPLIAIIICILICSKHKSDLKSK